MKITFTQLLKVFDYDMNDGYGKLCERLAKKFAYVGFHCSRRLENHHLYVDHRCLLGVYLLSEEEYNALSEDDKQACFPINLLNLK